jgi:hypothetical protein
MKQYLFYVISIIAIASSCKNGSQVGSTLTKDDGVEYEKKDSMQLAILVKKINENNKTGILHVVFDADTMALVSDKDLSWAPFGVDTHPDKIQQKFPSVFNKKDTMYTDSLTKKKVYGVLLKSQLSNLFFIKSDKPASGEDTDAEVADREYETITLKNAIVKDTIVLAYGVHIGMLKNDFFHTVLGFYDSTLNQRINVVINSDPAGEEIDIRFTFKKGILNEISMQSPY